MRRATIIIKNSRIIRIAIATRMRAAIRQCRRIKMEMGEQKLTVVVAIQGMLPKIRTAIMRTRPFSMEIAQMSMQLIKQIVPILPMTVVQPTIQQIILILKDPILRSILVTARAQMQLRLLTTQKRLSLHPNRSFLEFTMAIPMEVGIPL